MRTPNDGTIGRITQVCFRGRSLGLVSKIIVGI